MTNIERLGITTEQLRCTTRYTELYVLNGDLTAFAGSHIKVVAAQMATLAKTLNAEHATGWDGTIRLLFNGVWLVANAVTTADEICAFYQEESDRQVAAYKASPEYVERKRAREKLERDRANRLAALLANGPDEPSWRDQQLWQSWVDANQDNYGAACIFTAKTWACAMEAHMAKGLPLTADDVRELFLLANSEGVSGAMAGIAESMLSQAWAHGPLLARLMEKP